MDQVKQFKFRTTEWKFRDAKKEYPEIHFDGRVRITSPQESYNTVKDYFTDLSREHFGVLFLSSANKVIGFEVISIGNLNSSVVHPREVFRSAVVTGCASIIIFHNHPSGNLEPSNEDITITKKLVECGKLMDIPVFDHIIVTHQGFTSFVEKRLI